MCTALLNSLYKDGTLSRTGETLDETIARLRAMRIDLTDEQLDEVERIPDAAENVVDWVSVAAESALSLVSAPDANAGTEVPLCHDDSAGDQIETNEQGESVVAEMTLEQLTAPVEA